MNIFFRYSFVFSLVLSITTCSSKDWSDNFGSGTWKVAKSTCEANDMRLATIGELVKYYNDGIPFYLEKTNYWSSTPHDYLDGDIRYYTIHMNNGYVGKNYEDFEWDILCKKKE